MVVNLQSQTDLSGFYVIFNGSTNLENRGTYGISHLIEHLICKNFDELRDDFEKEGIDWNAYTTQNEVVFFFTGLDKFLSDRKYQIIDLICDFRVTKEQFEIERNIILQEYRNHFSDQTQCHNSNLMRKLFRDFNPIGLKQDLENMRFMDCLKFYEKNFQNPSKIINVSRKSLFKQDLDFYNAKIEKKYEFGPYRDVILEPIRNYGDKVSLSLVSKLIEEDFNYIIFINSMLSLGLSSPFYAEIREKRGLVYNIGCHLSRMNGQGVNLVNTETSLKNLQQLIESFEEIYKNPDKYFTKKRFQLIKNAYLIKFQKDRINRYQNVNAWINPPDWSVKKIIKTVTYEKVREVYDKYFKFGELYVSNDRSEFN